MLCSLIAFCRYIFIAIFALFPCQVSPRLLLDDQESSGQSSESSNSRSSLTLSISTIASVIADASISSDPAQLAAMIMELSKKSRSKSSQRMEVAGTTNIQDALQKTSSLADLTLDMEKYLKKAEVSSSDSDASGSQSCLDILSLADNLAGSHKPTQRQSPTLHNEVVKKDQVQLSSVSKQASDINSGKEVKKSDVKRSSIPRPKTSCIPIATAHPARRSVGAGQSLTSSTIKPKGMTSSSGAGRSKSECYTVSTGNTGCSGFKVTVGTAQPQASATRHSLKSSDSTSSAGRSELTTESSSPYTHRSKNYYGLTGTEESQSLRSPQASQAVGKGKQTVARQNSDIAQNKFGKFLFCLLMFL